MELTLPWISNIIITKLLTLLEFQFFPFQATPGS